jgi:imidazolonepropionase-like amidohydrolase
LLGNFGSKEDEMSGAKFTDEFKRDAVAQVEDRGYPVREVAERLGVSVKASQRQRVSISAGSLALIRNASLHFVRRETALIKLLMRWVSAA